MTPEQLESALRSFFEGNRDDVLAAWLFGSIARGTASASSDADIAVLFRRDPPRTLDGTPADLVAQLSAALGKGAPAIDVAVLNHASCDLVHRVLRDGVALVDRDPGARIRFEVRSRAAYFDLKPFLDRYRRRERRA